MTNLTTNKLKILNDPIYGLISIPKTIVFDLIEHPYFQRLRRISQMGLSYLVYPGAHHSRFHHATGCVYLMNKAVRVLRSKDIEITEPEETALYIAILLHDIGHGPFSHALEHSIVKGVNHEDLSLGYMELLNEEFEGELTLAIDIFKGNYHRPFFYQLVSSQLDIDRLDYLKRDSFYSGVAEGSINSDRLIAMMNVVDQQLVIEEKGIYSIEKFIVARRLMYWQVYLHKTGVVAENMLVLVLKRAQELISQNRLESCPENLRYFLTQNEGLVINKLLLERFASLDDVDIMFALKLWQNHEDLVLSRLARGILNRNLFRIQLTDEPVTKAEYQKIRDKIKSHFSLNSKQVDYLIHRGQVKNLAYNNIENKINLLRKDGSVVDFAMASDPIVSDRIMNETVRYFICFPKEINFSTL
ncbi:MAG: HD domain-containing protein [Flavobacteriaceae bacterium]